MKIAKTMYKVTTYYTAAKSKITYYTTWRDALANSTPSGAVGAKIEKIY